MSQTTPRPANEPIYTKGNWFWRGDERFLIKGISYIPRIIGGDPYDTPSKIDPLDDGRLLELKRDIAVFRELGLNTIQVSALSPGKDYSKAMNLLADAGIYVLVALFEDVQKPDDKIDKGAYLDTTPYYTVQLLKPALNVVDAMADYSNLLGFVVAIESINRPGLSKLAEVYRAAVRDIKFWLLERGGRSPPVGVSINDIAMIKRPMLEYFTAGTRSERVDFFAMDNWGWCYKSSFQISGWKSTVEAYGKYPVPMYLSAFGASAGKRRLWEEIGCLFSPDMTGVFSGGCAYTFIQGGNRHGIIRATGHEVKNKEEYGRLREQLAAVNQRGQEELFTAECKDYEGWEGVFPETGEGWHARPVLPQVPEGLATVIQELKDEKEWDVIESSEVTRDSENGEAVDQLSQHIGDMTIAKES